MFFSPRCGSTRHRAPAATDTWCVTVHERYGCKVCDALPQSLHPRRVMHAQQLGILNVLTLTMEPRSEVKA